jgi:hypothetical protein
VLRGICGPRRDEETRGWRKLHNEEHHKLYSSPSIIIMFKSKIMRWAGNEALMSEQGNAYRILAGKPVRKTILRKPRRRGWIKIK